MLKLRSSRAISSVAIVVVCVSGAVDGYSWFGRYSSSGMSDASLASSGVSASAANGLEVLDDSAVGVMIFGLLFITGQGCDRNSWMLYNSCKYAKN